MKPRLIAVLPTMLTLGNAACGFGAITFAAKLGPTDLTVAAGGGLFASNPSMVAALLVFLGMLFDMLDGSAARLTKQTSEMGAQLDSLCDAVTFGVAPAFLMLQFVTRELTDVSGLSFHPRLLWTIAALYTVCAILRLARFNVETEEEDSHEEFSGLPSPAAAGAVVGHQSGERDAGAAIGAGVGALGGYVIGNESDKQKQQYNNPNYNY